MEPGSQVGAHSPVTFTGHPASFNPHPFSVLPFGILNAVCVVGRQGRGRRGECLASGIVQSFRNIMPDLIGSRSGRGVLHFILSSHLQFGSTDLI